MSEIIPNPSQERIDEHISEVKKHKDLVSLNLGSIGEQLRARAITHDHSKMTDEELPYYAEYTPNLKGLTYGSNEYRDMLEKLRPCINHHYKANAHHPEHYENGIDGMSLVDLVEMICDWKAATARHEDGDIIKSLEINRVRFKMSDQLYNILLNTVNRDLQA
jgi:Family of unknown function (DUF5662)